MVGRFDEGVALETYTRFLGGLLEEGRRALLVAAVPPPLSNGEGEDDTMSSERTRRVNEALRSWCAAQGCRFLDYEPDILDPATGAVRDEFRLQGERKFALDPGAWSEVLAARLREMGYR